MLLSVQWTLSREKLLPKREPGPVFQPALYEWLKIPNRKWETKMVSRMNEQDSGYYNYPYQGSGFVGGQVLGTAKQRGRLCPTFVPPFMKHSLGCLSLAGINKGFSDDLIWGHTDASGIQLFIAILFSMSQYGAVGCLSSLMWELSGLGSVCVTIATSCFLELTFLVKIEFLLPPCHFVNQFYTWVIWKVTPVMRRQCHRVCL